ncbi:MAG: NAD-binding protein [Clostridiaceae bacterium]|nr:NAD-binding protein [Clostridiaceae bacterium]
MMFASKEVSGIIIAGGGRTGCCLAEQLNIADENVTVIDINRESFNKFMPEFSGSTIEGDASNIDVLRQAGISHARAVISATNNDNVNLMIAQIAREIYEVPIVIAMVNDSSLLSVKERFDFLILCPHWVMTQEVIKDLEKKEG